MEIPITTILISIGIVLFTLYKTWNLVRQILKKNHSQSWQISAAEVVSKRVNKRISTRSGVSYYPEIAYRYNVMGQSFEKTIRLPKNYSERKAQEKLDLVGTTIEVRYDPNQPKDHVSEYDIVNYPDIVVIMMFLVLVGIMLYPYMQ